MCKKFILLSHRSFRKSLPCGDLKLATIRTNKLDQNDSESNSCFIKSHLIGKKTIVAVYTEQEITSKPPTWCKKYEQEPLINPPAIPLKTNKLQNTLWHREWEIMKQGPKNTTWRVLTYVGMQPHCSLVLLIIIKGSSMHSNPKPPQVPSWIQTQKPNRAKHSSLTKVVTSKLPSFKSHLHGLTRDPFMKKVTFLAL